MQFLRRVISLNESIFSASRFIGALCFELDKHALCLSEKFSKCTNAGIDESELVLLLYLAGGTEMHAGLTLSRTSR